MSRIVAVAAAVLSPATTVEAQSIIIDTGAAHPVLIHGAGESGIDFLAAAK